MVTDGAFLEQLARAAETRQACGLSKKPHRWYLALGARSAPLMLIGEQLQMLKTRRVSHSFGPRSVLAEA